MDKVEDGGPAFPHDNQELGDSHRIAQSGMSLRDYFAGQALAGLLAHGDGGEFGSVTDSAASAARVAWACADALLLARKAGDQS